MVTFYPVTDSDTGEALDDAVFTTHDEAEQHGYNTYGEAECGTYGVPYWTVDEMEE